MLYYSQRKKLCRHLLVGGALFAAGLGMFSCSDTYDLDTDQPSGLNSIYGYMEKQGNYKNFMQLIEDLDQKEILSMTGSRTLFIADDDAFDRFYKNNKWGVSSYSQLSLSQKKLLLNSAMIDNPYTTTMLSYAAGDLSDAQATPVRGEVCRRNTSQSGYDTVLVVSTHDEMLPQDNSRFDEMRANRDSIVMFSDNPTSLGSASAAPMIHFNAKFLSANKITSEDIDFIYNQQAGTRQPDDTYINNTKITEANIFCKNGFVHKVSDVILPLDNMAEVIRKGENTKLFSSILERFAGLDYSDNLTRAYAATTGKEVDSVFIKRYYSERSFGSTSAQDKKWTADKNGNPYEGTLKYDPGWNGYVPRIANPRDGMMEDMAVMLAPTDEAITEWWNNGGGKVIKNYYAKNEPDVMKGLSATPASTLAELVNVNMLVSFNASVPSRFEDVLNDANEKMYLTKDSIESVELACNGAVYKTSKVYAPTSYSSVLFPAVVDTTNFKIIKKAIDLLDYKAYLNSMVADYSFLIPVNQGLITYVDPVSYGATTSNMWKFKYDLPSDNIYAEIYPCELQGDQWVATSDTYTQRVGWKSNKAIGPYNGQSNNSGDKILADRLEDILDNIIVLEPFKPGKTFYRTKGNSFVKVEGYTGNDDTDKANMKVYGSAQNDWGTPLHVTDIYTMSNGKSYVMDGVIMGTDKTVCGALANYNATHGDQFSEFLTVLQYSGAVNKTYTLGSSSYVSVDKQYGNLINIKAYGEVGAEEKPKNVEGNTKVTYLLNNFHYTLYAPTNDAMEKAYSMGLPRPADVDAAEEYDTQYEEEHPGEKSKTAAYLREAMLDFVKYHMHDNSIYMDEGFTADKYESSKTELIRATAANDDWKYVDEKHITVLGKEYETVNKITPDLSEAPAYYTGKYTPGRPYKIIVESVSAGGMTVKDNIGETHKVVVPNIMAREYWIEGKSISNAYSTLINNSSTVAIQGIDGPLVYDKDQFTYVYKPLDSNAANIRK